MVVLVTGASGQLGQALQSVKAGYGQIEFHFAASAEADITNPEALQALFERTKPDFCINAAAYTAVDKAESEPEKARAVNVAGARNLAGICRKTNCTLVHVSTDFVFDGSKSVPYKEDDPTNPQGIYGLTKRDGELEIARGLERYFIVRTSWVYSQFGHNFMKTMLRLAGERKEISVVNDQIGAPTYAVDLAHALLAIACSGKTAYGIYHYSNSGIASWCDFAAEIFRLSESRVTLHAIPTSSFPTPAKRPAYSVLDTSRTRLVFGIEIRDWKQALAEAVKAVS